MTKQTGFQCDVLVVGGGAAGVAAAVGAARSGADVILLEKYGFLGGMATAAMVSTVCGCYLRSTKGKPQFMSGGFVQEFARRLSERQHTVAMSLPHGLFVLPFAPWHLVRLADILASENLVRCLFHAHLGTVKMSGKSVAEVDCCVWNMPVSIHPVCVVDCTGDSALVEAAGGNRLETSQDSALLFRLEGLSTSTQMERVAFMRKIVDAVARGLLPDICRNISFVPGHMDGGSIIIKLPIPFSAMNPQAITEMEFHGRQAVEEMLGFLVAESLLSPDINPLTATQTGIRAGYVAEGEATLTAEQVMDCRKHQTGVARGCWPIELWHGGRRPETIYLHEEDYYDIPVGCMVAKGFDNVFMGGRCISADSRALGSARVIGTALGTGYAAGTLAAFQASGKQRDKAITVLREQQSTKD